MSKSIWYISKYVSPPGSGTSSGRGYLLMKEFASLGNKILIITSDSNKMSSPPLLEGKYLFQEIDGLQLCWVRTLKYSVANSLRRVLSWLHFEWGLLLLPKKNLIKPDVLIVSSLSLLTVLSGLLLRARFKSLLVFEVRDIWPLTLTAEGGYKRYNPLVWGLSLIEWLGYKYANVIIGTMPNLSEHVENVLGYKKTTYCIPMGIDEPIFALTKLVPADYEEKYLPIDKFVVAHVGSIGISNALETFLACAEAMQDNKDIQFLVIGEGDLREIYKNKYAHLNNITFAPRVAKDLVQAILVKCDLLYLSVHLSKVWRYGQSLNKLIDYMMSGRPILASYTGHLSMINEANCGSFVAAADVNGLRQELERYAKMSKGDLNMIGARGRLWLLENRNYSQLARKYLEIISDNSK